MFEQYHEYESHLAALQVVLVTVGLGTTLHFRDFVSVVGRPLSLLIGCACQFLLAPLLTMLLLNWIDLDAGVAVGLILISAMPGGPLANLFTYLAEGNVALSIALTGIGTIGSLVTVPVLLGIFAQEFVASGFEMPVLTIVADVVLYLFAPLVAGMLLRILVPQWSGIASAWMVRAGLLILCVIVVGSLGSGRIVPLAYGWGTPTAIIVLCLVIQNVSMAIFLPFRWSVADQTAVGVGVAIRNINLALLLAARLFPATATEGSSQAMGGGVLYAILFWGALSLIVCVPTIFVQRRALAAETRRRMPTVS